MQLISVKMRGMPERVSISHRHHACVAVCRLGKLGKEVDEAQLEVNKMEKVLCSLCPCAQHLH